MKLPPRSFARLILGVSLLLFGISPSFAQVSNVALNKTVRVDSVDAAWKNGDNAVDGDSANSSDRWVSDGAPFPHWIEIETGNNHVLSQLKFWTGDPGSYSKPLEDFQLQYWDGWDWIDVMPAVSGNIDSIVDMTFPPFQAGERIRLYATAGLVDNYARVYEVEIYGEPAPLSLVSRSPLPESRIVDVNQPIVLEFNRPIAFANQSLLRYRNPADNSSIGPFNSSISGSTLTLTPDQPMPYGQAIEVVIPNGTLQASDDATVLNNTFIWEFETLPEIPQVLDYPRELHDTSADIVVNHDRNLSLLDPTKVSVSRISTGAPLPGVSVTVSGSDLVFSHGGLATNEIYFVEILPGALADAHSGTSNDTRFAFGLYAGILTMWASDFDNGRDGLGVNGRWGWTGLSNLDGSLGSMSSGSSDPAKYMFTPLLSLDAAFSYQVNYQFSWSNPGAVGVMPYLPNSSNSDWQNSPDWQLIRVGSGGATFSPSATGDYHLLVTNDLESVGNAYQSSSMDNLSIKKAVAPAVMVSSPVSGASYNEGATIPVRFDATGLAGEIVSVTLYDPLDERELASWSSPAPDGYSFDWSYYTTPGQRDLQITVVDNTGLQTVLSQPVTINLADGSLPSLIHFDFDRSMEGFTGNVGHLGNDYGPGSAGLKPNSSPPFFASPVLFLLPGETYTVSFDYKNLRSDGYFIYGFLPSPTPAYSETMVEDQLFQLNNREWTRVSHTFTVPVNGPYHLMFFEKQKVGTSQSDILFDNVRLSGSFNSAPTVSLTNPENGTNAIVGSTVHLEAIASDLDGFVTEVRFMRGSRILHTDTEAPYEYDYALPVAGEVALHAVAYDNNLGYTASNSVTVNVGENHLSQSTFLGNSNDAEAFYQTAYQSDGTLLVAGQLDPGLFPGASPVYLNGTAPGDRGVVARLSEDGQQVLGVTVVGSTVVTDMTLDDADNIYLALHADGAVALDPTGSTVLWSHDWSKHSHRIDAGPNGTVAVLTAPQPDWNDKQLFDAQAIVINSSGSEIATLSGAGHFTTDLAYHEPSQTVIMVAFKNINTDTNPVDIPQMVARDLSNNVVWRAYDWNGNPGTAPNPVNFSNGGVSFASAFPSWDPVYQFGGPVIDSSNPNPPTVDVLLLLSTETILNSYTNSSGNGYYDAYASWRNDWDRWLNRPENNMADTRGARVLIADDGLLYASFEYDGGNTPLRYDPFSLDQKVPIVGGDSHHEMSFTTTVPKVFIGRYQPTTGDYILGQWITNRLSDGRDNTIRMDRNDFAVDSLGRVHVAGRSSAGIDISHDFIPGAYSGGAYYLVYSPDFSNREMWTRVATSGEFHGVAVSPSGMVALGGWADNDSLFTSNAWQPAIASGQDAMLVVGNMEPYFEFHVGEHPRLFFSAEDIPELRSRLTQEPYQSIYQRMLDALDVGRFGDVYDPNFIYDRTTRAQLLAFLYTLTGNEAYAAEARTHVEAAFLNTEYPWADPGSKGLGLYWIGTRVAVCYDLLVNSDSWDSAFDYEVSKKLYDMARVVVEQGGSEQNSSTGSNWQGARGAAGALMALAMDHEDDRGLVSSGFDRVENYINAAYGGSGWINEGTGYFYFPVGNYIGPMGIAMARHDPTKDLRDETAFTHGFWAAMASNVSNTNPYSWGGIQSDWSDDNPAIGGEGVYGLAFHYLPEHLQGPYQFAYDVSQGALSPTDTYNPVWDSYRAGSMWSYLFYPSEGRPYQPAESYAWHQMQSDPNGLGIYTFRDRFQDGQDLLAQVKMRLNYLESGHDAPDGLGFRINAGGDPFVIGGGRNSPMRNIGQATVYPVNPSDGSSISVNGNGGNLIGTPLITPRGDGHIIGQMDVNNVSTSNHKRWFVANYDSAQTGADAAFLIADTTANGQFWHFNTYLQNDIVVSGNTFTITGDNGAVLQGTLLYPTSGFSITTGNKDYGSSIGFLNGGMTSDFDEVTNPRIQQAKYLQIEHPDGEFLVVMTVQRPGSGTQPVVAQSSGTVSDAVVTIGSLEIALQTDDILYNGSAFSHPDAVVTFDPGSNGSITAGDTVQTVAYGASPVEPTVTANPGWVFQGWDKDFTPALTDSTVTAVYAALEPIPTAPDLLAANAVSASQIALSWRDRSVGETDFAVEASADGTNWSLLVTLPAESEAYAHTGLSPESTFFYRVKAIGTGGDSAYTNVASATTLAPNTPPSFDNGGLLAANEGQLYFHTLFASDLENDSLVFSPVLLPAWLSLSDFGDGSADLVGTPGNADVGSHPVTIAVSDGVNPAVELSFTIEVNGAPVLSLVSPVQQPARIPSGQGIEAEMEAVDTLPVTLSWSAVGGPGDLTFDLTEGMINGIQASADGLYTIRVTASDSAGATSFLDFQVEWGGSAVSALPVTLLEWGSPDQITGDFRNAGESTQMGLDWDGDGADDGVAFWPFRSDAPLSKGTYTSPDSRNFYGGFMAQGIEATPNLSNVGISGSTPYDKIGARVQGAGVRIAFPIYWDIQDFSNLPAGATVSLGAEASLSIPSGFGAFAGSTRWMVRNGNQFYVSDTPVSDDLVGKEISGSELVNTMWAPYNPVEGSWDMHFDTGAASYDTPTSALQNITGVGFIISRQNFVDWRIWYTFEDFQFVGLVVVPDNLAPVIAMGPSVVTEPGLPADLGASASDDGLPAVPGSVTYEWTTVGGPASGIFGDPSLVTTTFSASVEGDYTVRLTGDDGEVRPFAQKTVTVSGVSDPFADWFSAYPGVPLPSQTPEEDWDGDGIAHLLEYAFGLSPVASSLVPVWADNLGPAGGLSMDMTHQRADLTYTVQVSDNLAGWTDIATAQAGGAMLPVGGVTPAPTITVNGNIVTVSDLWGALTGGEQGFIRVMISR